MKSNSTVIKNKHPVIDSHRRYQGRIFDPSDRRAGFSLIEVMVVIAIFAILSAIAVPNAIAWRNNARFNAAVREIKSAIEGARMAAVRSSLQSNITFNGDNTFTTQTQRIVDGATAAGTVVNHWVAGGITVSWNHGSTLTFNSRGMPAGGMGSVTIQYKGLLRKIAVSIVGSSRII